MIPSYILGEVIDRLATPLVSQRTVDRVLRAVGINFEQTLGMPTDVPNDVAYNGSAGVFTGALEFDMAVMIGGFVAQHRCRAVYSMKIDDQEQEDTGQALRIPVDTSWHYEILTWDAEESADQAKGVFSRRSTPRWLQADLFFVIPRAADNQIIEMVEAEVLRRDAANLKERGRPQ